MAANVQLCLSGPRTPDVSLADHVRAASEAGFLALDLVASSLDATLAMYPVIWLYIELQKHHVYATSVSGVELLAGQTREDTLVHEADFLNLCTRLDALGGGTVAVWPGIGAGGERDRTQTASWIVRALRSYSALAAPFEVRIAFESPPGAYQATYTLKARQEIVRQVARGNVGLALSIEQLRKENSGPEDLETLDVSKLWLVRLESALLQSPTSRGEEPICKHLAAKKFHGPYCVAWPPSAPAAPQTAGSDSLIERVRRARQVALELLAPLYP